MSENDGMKLSKVVQQVEESAFQCAFVIGDTYSDEQMWPAMQRIEWLHTSDLVAVFHDGTEYWFKYVGGHTWLLIAIFDRHGAKG